METDPSRPPPWPLALTLIWVSVLPLGVSSNLFHGFRPSGLGEWFTSLSALAIGMIVIVLAVRHGRYVIKSFQSRKARPSAAAAEPRPNDSSLRFWLRRGLQGGGWQFPDAASLPAEPLAPPMSPGRDERTAQALRSARELVRKSQEHVAMEAGISVRTLRRAETTGKVSPECLRAICAALSLQLPGDAHAAPQNYRPLWIDIMLWAKRTGLLLWSLWLLSPLTFAVILMSSQSEQSDIVIRCAILGTFIVVLVGIIAGNFLDTVLLRDTVGWRRNAIMSLYTAHVKVVLVALFMAGPLLSLQLTHASMEEAVARMRQMPPARIGGTLADGVRVLVHPLQDARPAHP